MMIVEDVSKEKKMHEQFIKQVCETGIVWGLENEEGFAMASSAEFENSEGEPVEVLCFWSDKGLANSCINDEWTSYKPAQVKIGEFMESWCLGMYEDELLTGTNFDPELAGYELEPLDLILELCDELKKRDKQIDFENYADLDEFIEEVKSIKNEE
jgi:hypothetical protein